MCSALDYTEVAEGPLEVAVPTSPGMLRELAELCGLEKGDPVLDVGCGHGFLLRYWAKGWGVHGTGLERSATALDLARQKAGAEGVADRLHWVHGPATDAATDPGGYRAVTCLGASFALGGFGPAARWMAGRVRPGGTLAIGEPYLKWPVPAEVLRREGSSDLQTREVLLDAMRQAGCTPVGIILAPLRQWDRYCTSSWRAVAAWARANPGHPDRFRLECEARVWRRRYHRFARRTVGWALFVGRPERQR